MVDKIDIYENQLDLLHIAERNRTLEMAICPNCREKTILTNICENCGIEDNRLEKLKQVFQHL